MTDLNGPGQQSEKSVANFPDSETDLAALLPSRHGTTSAAEGAA